MKRKAPAVDHNPDHLRCTICGDTKGLAERLETLVGTVCGCCHDGAAPKSAPYWRDWEFSATPGQRTTLGHRR